MSDVPAQSLDAEESVLGAMLQADYAIDAVLETGLKAEDFYRYSFGDIFKTIVSLHEEGKPVDVVTVAAAGHDAVTLQELTALMPSTLNAAHWAKIVKEESGKRDVISLAQDLASKAQDGVSAADLLAHADSQLLRLQAATTKHRDRIFTGRQIVQDYRSLLENPLDDDRAGIRAPSFVSWPLMGSRLYVLGGYTGDGKTAMALQFLASACEGGTRVGFHSIEMSRNDLAHRLIASFGVPYHDVRTGHVLSNHRPTVERALKTIEGWDWEIIDDEQVVPSQIRRDQRAGKYDFLIVDHLHRMPIKDKRHERAELEDHVRRMTNISKEFDIPVLLLAQLSREDKRNPFPRPTLASLKGTGAIEQEAALVWFVWRIRDENHNPQSDAELIVAKNRHGGLSFKNLYFRASQVRFAESAFD